MIKVKEMFKNKFEAFRTCFKRFPITVAFVSALAIYLIYIVAAESQYSQAIAVTGYYLSVGTLLSLALHLWSEEKTSVRGRMLIHVIGHTILIVDAIFLYYTSFENSFTELGIAHFAGILTIGLSMFVLPFFKEKNDIPSWNFTLQCIKSLASAALIGIVMYIGICLLLASLKNLFGLNINYKCYLYAIILTCVWLAMMLFVGQLPRGGKKHDTSPLQSNFLSGVMRCLILPLGVAYLAILYVYAIKIVVDWELPNGWVSWAVTALMTVCLILEFGLYPNSVAAGKKKQWDKQVLVLMPLMTLPLLLLMTIGIIRRFCDYGVTINRLYLITLNIWFYVVCIGLLVNRRKRIIWIPVSFSIIFLLTSVFPINFSSYTRGTLYSYLEEQVKTTYKGKLPMDNESYLDWLDGLPREEAVEINSKMQYMTDWFGASSCGSFWKDSYLAYYDDVVKVDTTAVETLVAEPINQNDSIDISFKADDGNRVNIPQGYTSFYWISSYEYFDEEKEIIAVIPVQINIYRSGISDTVYFDLRTLRMLAACKKENGYCEVKEFTCKSDRHKFVLDSFSLKTDKSYVGLKFEYSGFLFKK